MAKITLDISHEQHLSNDAKVNAFVEVFGPETYRRVLADLKNSEQIIVNGVPVTSKSQVRDPKLYAQYFQALREKGLQPLEVYNTLPE